MASRRRTGGFPTPDEIRESHFNWQTGRPVESTVDELMRFTCKDEATRRAGRSRLFLICFLSFQNRIIHHRNVVVNHLVDTHMHTTKVKEKGMGIYVIYD